MELLTNPEAFLYLPFLQSYLTFFFLLTSLSVLAAAVCSPTYTKDPSPNFTLTSQPEHSLLFLSVYLSYSFDNLGTAIYTIYINTLPFIQRIPRYFFFILPRKQNPIFLYTAAPLRRCWLLRLFPRATIPSRTSWRIRTWNWSLRLILHSLLILRSLQVTLLSWTKMK